MKQFIPLFAAILALSVMNIYLALRKRQKWQEMDGPARRNYLILLLVGILLFVLVLFLLNHRLGN